jgi:hypothetical protein
MPAEIRIDPALGQARDLAGLHLLLQNRQRDAEALGDHGRVDLKVAVAEFDRFHAVPRAGLGFDRAG